MPLSFGFEIHAIIYPSPHPHPHPHPHPPLPPTRLSNSKRVREQLRLVTSTLAGSSAAAGGQQQQQQPRSRLSAKVNAWIPRSPRDVPDFAVWNVMREPTIFDDDTAEREHPGRVGVAVRFGVLLVSPMFGDGCSLASGGKWEGEVEKALCAFDDVSDKAVRWEVKEGTSLHVHVGPAGEDASFDLEEVKRIAMMVVRFEDAIDALYVGHKVLKKDTRGLSNRRNEALKDLSLAEIYTQIQAVTDVVGIVKLLNYVPPEQASMYANGSEESKFFKVNFASLAMHNSIEFRQHEGTVDPRSVIAWMKFVVGFVEFAVTSTVESVAAASGNGVDDLGAVVPLPN